MTSRADSFLSLSARCVGTEIDLSTHTVLTVHKRDVDKAESRIFGYMWTIDMVL